MPGVYEPAYQCEICRRNFSRKSIVRHHVAPRTIAPELVKNPKYIKFLCKDCHTVMTRLMDTNLAHPAQLKAEGKLQELERECWRIYDIVANGICSILKKLSSLEGEKIKGESKRGEASFI